MESFRHYIRENVEVYEPIKVEGDTHVINLDDFHGVRTHSVLTEIKYMITKPPYNFEWLLDDIGRYKDGQVLAQRPIVPETVLDEFSVTKGPFFKVEILFDPPYIYDDRIFISFPINEIMHNIRTLTTVPLEGRHGVKDLCEDPFFTASGRKYPLSESKIFWVNLLKAEPRNNGLAEAFREYNYALTLPKDMERTEQMLNLIEFSKPPYEKETWWQSEVGNSLTDLKIKIRDSKNLSFADWAGAL